MRHKIRFALALALAFLWLPAWSIGAEEAMATKAAAEKSELSVPETPQAHLSRAATYEKRAADYREEAAAHRSMFADYKKKHSSPSVESKTGREMSWVTKMRAHCEEYARQAEKMAAEADRFAEFHRMRAAEMKGQ